MKEIFFGIVSGIVAALGMGGGTVLILLFSLFSAIQQHLIQGINLVFFVPTSMIAIWMNIRRKTIDYKVAIPIIICGMVGAIVGSLISFQVDNQNLRKYYGIFLILIAILQAYGYLKNAKRKK